MGQFQCQAETVALLNGAIISPPGSLQQNCGLLMKLMIINKRGAFHPYLEPEIRKKISSGYLVRFSVFKIVFRVQDCASCNRSSTGVPRSTQIHRQQLSFCHLFDGIAQAFPAGSGIFHSAAGHLIGGECGNVVGHYAAGFNFLESLEDSPISRLNTPAWRP
jgi:hypothetical protein